MISYPPKQKIHIKTTNTKDDVDDIDVELENDKTEINFDDQYVLFQLPKHLPTYTQPPSAVKLEPGVESVEVDEPATEEKKFQNLLQIIQNYVGK